MKRCPECRRDYLDESLLYCLDDGTRLLDGPVSVDEAATAFLHSPVPLAEAATRAKIDVTNPTAVLPSTRTQAPHANSKANSIAVLPFTHMSSDADNEYFGAGLAEELWLKLLRL